MPTRELYWNIAGHLILYAFVAAGAVAFIYGVWRHWRNWRIGRPAVRWDKPWERVKSFLSNTVLHLSVLKEAYPGLMHAGIFYGFVVLTAGTAIVLLQADLGLHVFYGPFYLWVSLALDILGLAAIAGLLLAIFRRYILRPKRLETTGQDAVILVGLLVILCTGYFIEGLRLAAEGDQWALWSPVGLVVAKWFGATLGAGGVLAPVAGGAAGGGAAGAAALAGIEAWHRYLWWFHMLLAVGLVSYMPYSKLFHVFLAPANQFLRNLRPKGALAHVDIENTETFGASRLDEFTWKDLFDANACTRCGRCQDQCPANAAGKKLSPKEVIQNMRKALEKYGPVIAATKAKVRARLLEEAAKAAADKGGPAGAPAKDAKGRPVIDPAKEYEALEEAMAELEMPSLIDETITEDVIWSCTTCRSCEEQCPIFVEVIPKIVEMRRYLVLMESRMPTEAGRTLRSLQNNGNPWGLARTARGEWTQKVQVRKLAEGEEVEYLYWVGCFGAFDDRSKAITEATVRVFQAADVDFGVIGEGETCCGDSARRLGNEYLYQTMAQENIETLKAYKFKKIVTGCPHCYNALKNEYPQLGGNFEVVHTSQLIAELLAGGKLKLSKKLEGQAARVTYHDPCYLGRYNDEFAAPRKVIAALGGQIAEMPRHGKTSFCCGAGGGRMWLEEEAAHKVNARRAEQALATKAGTVVTACPFCLQMFDDGLKSVGEQKDITKDLAELVAKAL